MLTKKNNKTRQSTAKPDNPDERNNENTNEKFIPYFINNVPNIRFIISAISQF